MPLCPKLNFLLLLLFLLSVSTVSPQKNTKSNSFSKEELKRSEKKAAKKGNYQKALELLYKRAEKDSSLLEGAKTKIHSYAQGAIVEEISPFPKAAIRDLMYDFKVDFVLGWSYYVPFNEKTQGDTITYPWGSIHLLKGDFGWINQLHQQALENPGQVVRLDERGLPRPGEAHNGASLQKALIDTIKERIQADNGVRVDSFRLRKAEMMNGIRISEEFMYDREAHRFRTRLNFLTLRNKNRWHGGTEGFYPIYALPFLCRFERCGEGDHLLHEKGRGWGFKNALKTGHTFQNPMEWKTGRGSKLSSFEPHGIVELLIEGEKAGLFSLFRDHECKETFSPSSGKEDIDGMIVQEVLWYHETKDRVRTDPIRIGMVKEEKDNELQVVKNYKPLFWYHAAQNERK